MFNHPTKTPMDAETRKARFAEAIATAPEVVKTRYLRDFDRLSFKDDDDFNAYLEEIRPDIEKMATERKPTPEEAHRAAVEARIKANEAQMAAPAVAGFPEGYDLSKPERHGHILPGAFGV